MLGFQLSPLGVLVSVRPRVLAATFAAVLPMSIGFPSLAHAACGDGILDGEEACDDGNTWAGDGCSDGCAVEAGYTCTSYSTNLVTDPGFAKALCPDWQADGLLPCEADLASSYGGPSGSNRVAEIDPLHDLDQSLELVSGATYVVRFLASRTTAGTAPDPSSGAVSVSGTSLALGSLFEREGTTFALTPSSATFTAAGNSGVLRFAFASPSVATSGIVIDDVVVTRATSCDGPPVLPPLLDGGLPVLPPLLDGGLPIGPLFDAGSEAEQSGGVSGGALCQATPWAATGVASGAAPFALVALVAFYRRKRRG